MCLTSTKVRHFRRWNWDGDQISPDTVIKAMRKTPNTRERYDIDIREFLGYNNSAVISRTMRNIVDGLSPEEQAFFRSRKPGSFDFRAQAVLRFLSDHVAYKPRSRKFDSWLFPEETLAEGGGDCEDRAFLVAALLLAAGISGYCVRVVLGRLYNHAEIDPAQRSKEHVWAMYKNEEGTWQILEPQILHSGLSKTPSSASDGESGHLLEYIPYYAFNDTHLWYIFNRDEDQKIDEFIHERTNFFEAFDPAFAISVHAGLLHSVLDQHLTSAEMAWVTSYNFAIDALGSIGPVYNPYQHFDNGYIKDGWDFVQSNIQKRTLTSFVRAGHAIADFYAHTSYGEFAGVENDRFTLWDGRITADTQSLQRQPDYGQPPFTIADREFTVNACVKGKVSRTDVVSALNEHILISGRFAQKYDQHEALEGVVTYPQSLYERSDYEWRTRLPHHNEIAVDEQRPAATHKLYDADQYTKQFTLRTNSAIKHMATIYEQMRNPRLFK